jgi:hypothetical protein
MNRASIEAALRTVNDLKTQLEAILAEDRSPAAKANGPFKRSDGRLTEAGVRELRRLLEEGRTPSDVARTLDMTVPAVLHQRNRYLVEKSQA